MTLYDGCKVFSATKAKDRTVLGEKVTQWLRQRPGVEIADKQVRLSSDSEFHCMSITLFYRGNDAIRRRL